MLLIALGAGALALPADPTSLISPSILGERALVKGEGSIAGFTAPDCTGPPVGARPQDSGLFVGEDRCITFSSDMNDMIGINWGNTGHWIVNSLFVYSDTTCTNRVDVIPAKKMRKRGKGPPTNSCVSQKDYGGPWKSVKYVHEPICSDADANNRVCPKSNVGSLEAREPTGSESGVLDLPASNGDSTTSTSSLNLKKRSLDKRFGGQL